MALPNSAVSVFACRFNWGLNVRKKSERVLKLLEKGPLYKEERDKARKISRGIQGFGSFSHRTSSGQEILQQSTAKTFGRCNTQFTDHSNQEDFFSLHDQNGVLKIETEKTIPVNNQVPENLFPRSLSGNQVDTKENLAPDEGVLRVRRVDEGSLNCIGESKPLLSDRRDEPSKINMLMADHHPFDDDAEHLTALSLLSSADHEPQPNMLN